MGDLRKKRDYKLSNFQRTTNLTQHVLDCLVLKSGADRDRTDDLLLAKQALSQLSYSPFNKLVGPEGIEPSTSRLSSVRSNQLSYEPKQKIGLAIYKLLKPLKPYVRVADLKRTVLSTPI